MFPKYSYSKLRGPRLVRGLAFRSVSRPPSSLCQIVRLFQWFGISFGGVDHREPMNHHKSRLFPKLWNVFLFVLVVAMLIIFFGTNSSQLQFEETFNSQQTKPILDHLVRSVMYMLTLNNLFGMVYFSLIGGRPLVVHLCNTKILQNTDRDSRLFWSMLQKLIIYIFVMCSIEAWIDMLGLFRKYEPMLGLIYHSSGKFIGQLVHYAVFSSVFVQLIIIVYVVRVYSDRLAQLQTKIVQPTLSQLTELRHQVHSLDRHFSRTIQLLQFSILFNVITCTWGLIGSICMLLLVPDLSNFIFTGIIVASIADSSLVLAVIVFSSNQVHHQYCHLLEQIRLRHRQWTPLKLLYFQRLSTNSTYFSQFQLRLYRTFSLNQTMLISLSTFILNYIVLLIQTGHSRSPDDQNVNNYRNSSS